MKILRTIGGFFVKIWRWIKNTAWVQPLLIVGAIFGVIFSIPAITSGIQGLIRGANSAETFYSNFKRSLEGGENSSADTLIENYYTYKEEYNNTPEAEQKDFWKKVPEKERKFFLMFNAKGNATTKEIKSGFEVLRDNWGNAFRPDDLTSFRLYTIYTDEKTSETTKYETAFSKFLYREYSFFEETSAVGFDSNYYLTKHLTKEDLDNLATPGPDNFKIPTLILVDWRFHPEVYPSDEQKEPGVTQVMFDVPGENSYEKAKLLYQCWNNRGDFSSDPDR